MDPVLIYTDTEKINSEIAVLNKVVTLYQAVYTAIKALGVTPTIAEIDTLVQFTKRRNNQGDFVNDYILNKLTDAAAPYVLNGIPITRESVKGMISMPDTTALKTALNGAFQTFSGDVGGARIILLSLAADVISKVGDANAQITAIYTYYTKTDASATLATGLQSVCNALNTFDEANGDFFAHKIPPGNLQTMSKLGDTIIPGIAFSQDAFVVSLSFIRKFEELGSL